MKSAIPSKVKIYFVKKSIMEPERRLKHLQMLAERYNGHWSTQHGGYRPRGCNFGMQTITESIEILEKEILENIIFDINQ